MRNLKESVVLEGNCHYMETMAKELSMRFTVYVVSGDDTADSIAKQKARFIIYVIDDEDFNLSTGVMIHEEICCSPFKFMLLCWNLSKQHREEILEMEKRFPSVTHVFMNIDELKYFLRKAA